MNISLPTCFSPSRKTLTALKPVPAIKRFYRDSNFSGQLQAIQVYAEAIGVRAWNITRMHMFCPSSCQIGKAQVKPYQLPRPAPYRVKWPARARDLK